LYQRFGRMKVPEKSIIYNVRRNNTIMTMV
jgi:hypothetical protein